MNKLKWLIQATILGMYSYFYGLIYIQSLIKNFVPITIEINRFGEGFPEIIAFGILLILGTYFIVKDYLNLDFSKRNVNNGKTKTN